MNEATILRAMRARAEECRDRRTGEMNYTKLAETVAADLDLDGDDEIPERLFELATRFD